jgi:hypothetical protein
MDIKNIDKIVEVDVTKNTIVLCETAAIVHAVDDYLLYGVNGYARKTIHAPASVLFETNDTDYQVFITVEPAILMSMRDIDDVWFCGTDAKGENIELYTLSSFKAIGDESLADIFKREGPLRFYREFICGRFGAYTEDPQVGEYVRTVIEAHERVVITYIE